MGNVIILVILFVASYFGLINFDTIMDMAFWPIRMVGVMIMFAPLFLAIDLIAKGYRKYVKKGN